jgi:hypothetical protein
MRRRLFISMMALTLAAGSIPAAAGAASASAATAGSVTVQPGGPARHLVRPLPAHGYAPGVETDPFWSGYVTTTATMPPPAEPFTSVSAHWKEPTASCPAGNQYSAFWVGLDGDTSSTVEQTGTAVDCDGTTPVYYAWYEMYPKDPVNFDDPVMPRDSITASVTYNGSGKFTLEIKDTTKPRVWTETVHKTLASAKRASAEVIIEAPCCTGAGGPLPLADFGTVTFTSAQVNGEDIGGFNPTEIIMQSGTTQKDSITGLMGGETFTGTWLHR